MNNEIVKVESETNLAVISYPADQNPALVYLASLSEGSRRTMRNALDAIAAMVLPDSDHASFPWHQLRYQHTQAIRSMLVEQYSASNANKHMSALRSVIKEAWRLGYVSAEDYQRAVDIKSEKRTRIAQAEKGRHLQAGEFSALIKQCLDGTAKGARDAAIIILGYTAGLRRTELASLELGDIDLAECSLKIRDSKSGDRVVYVGNAGCDAILDWLHFRGDEDGPLFKHIRRGDHIQDTGMTDQAVYNVIKDLADRAGVRDFSPHDLRRTYAGNMLDSGVDIVTVQKLMGHASTETTAGYDRRDSRAKKDAANRLHVPYTRQYE